MKRPLVVALLFALLLFALGGLGSPGVALADDDFFQLSPGPLSKGHAEFDNASGCTKCHKIGQGVTDFLCLDCHQHKDLKEAIAAKRGLHAGFKDPCRKCHTEHKGRSELIIDWSSLGGVAKFDHKRTGFALSGKHKTSSCTACHKKKLSSGHTSYVGLLPDCATCHANVHQFTNATLVEKCTSCHDPAGLAKKDLAPSEIPFDHGKQTGLALTGKHGETRCIECHERARMSMPAKARTCVDCHRNPHGKTFEASKCTKCHAPEREFKKSSFSHDQTEFPLRGEHAKATCSKCHKSLDQKPKTTCASCHGDPHKKRFAQVDCESCHSGNGGTTAVRFDHRRIAKFALTGKHANLACRSCHRGQGPTAFERFANYKDAGCMGCHAHKNAHDGQFKEKGCLDCHKEGGSKELEFDHSKDTRFALTGFHAELEKKNRCDKCHKDGEFKTNKVACRDCHKDSHKGELGPTCERCHSTSVRYKEIVFDHDRLSSFPLEGLHEKAECKACHPKRKYKLGDASKRCAACHMDDEPHAKKLGDHCERCHIPDKGAPKFVHDEMTAFHLTGAHATVACTFCHRPRPATGPQAVGWTKTLAVTPADRTFPVMGKACSDCHLDVHAGKNGLHCDSCHDTRSFKGTSRAVHDTGAFRLMGVHEQLACKRCHDTDRHLAGIGDVCQSCHREDDIHSNALGPFCGDCHSQIDWRPARFNHTTTGFALLGSHRMAACRDCHGVGNYTAIPRDCEACHLPRAASVSDPVHSAELLIDCARCHSEISFRPARRYHPWYPLRGAHQTARCMDCHAGGQYAGVGRDCEQCHRDRFEDPATRPDHRAAGFSTRCEDCHLSGGVAWTPARYQHQTFVLRGSHAVAGCERCHTGEVYGAAFGGSIAAFECALCHGPGGPVTRWPADHGQRGYPLTCDLCHFETGWSPARSPR